MSFTELVENNAYFSAPHNFFPYHEAFDKSRLSTLTDSLEASGWTGIPVVQYGGQLLTGSHRYEAARSVGIDLKVVDLCDVFDLNAEEIDDLIADHDNWVVEATYLAISNNQELANLLEMDAH